MDYLVCGLGNPGTEYVWTYHNLGFMVIDRLAGRNNILVSRRECKAFVGVAKWGGREVMLAKPQTFMNLSGESVGRLVEKYELAPSQVVVVYDELDLSWGSLRIRKKGSDAGHNGMEDVIRRLGTQEIVRVRLGIHPGHPVRDGAEFVLTAMSSGQRKELEEILDHAAGAVESIVAEGAEKAMTKYNRRALGQE